MKPFVICHMMCTVDGRIVGDRWSPPAEGDMWSAYGRDYEFIHDQLVGDAWLVGRKTMTEFAKGEPWPGLSTAGIDRSNFIANTTARGYAIGVDPKGKLHYHTSVANGNHNVSVLTEQVEDEYLAELGRAGSPTSLPARPKWIWAWRSTSSGATSPSTGCCSKVAAPSTARSSEPG
jgi:hypothetical protein